MEASSPLRASQSSTHATVVGGAQLCKPGAGGKHEALCEECKNSSTSRRGQANRQEKMPPTAAAEAVPLPFPLYHIKKGVHFHSSSE